MELIDLRQLRAFQTLAETRSFTAAAQKLYLTQSAVSHSIKTLETSLDCRLFDRVGRTVNLTPHGRVLLKRSLRIFNEMDLAGNELADLGAWGQGQLRIGATMTMCQYLLPSVLREFRETFPECEIRIEPGDTEEILHHLYEDRLDMALGMKHPRQSKMVTRALFEDELALVTSPTHPWASKKKLRREDFESERFIVYAKDSYTYRLIESYFDKQGIALRAPLELGNMEAIKEMAKVGLGVGIVAPWIASEELANQTLVYRAITKPQIQREWVVFMNRGKETSLAEETFVGLCETVAHTLALDLPTGTGQAAN